MTNWKLTEAIKWGESIETDKGESPSRTAIMHLTYAAGSFQRLCLLFDDLYEYVRHGPDCATRHSVYPCDCGLLSLLKKIKWETDE